MATNDKRDNAFVRSRLEDLIAADLRALTVGSDSVGLQFGRRHHLRGSDLRGLLHIMVAETSGQPLNCSELQQRMQISLAAVSYVVDRIVAAGHIRRESDPRDRRKTLLRMEDSAMALGREYFAPLGGRISSAVADMPDADLRATRRVMRKINAAMEALENDLRQQPSPPRVQRQQGKQDPPDA